MSKRIKVGITHGDMNGVGYEVILKSLADETILDMITPVVFGFTHIAEKCRLMLGLEEMRFHRVPDASAAQDGRINIVDISKNEPELTPGHPSEESGRAAVEALRCGVAALKEGEIDVLVTAPICKENVQSETFSFPGHTEFLEDAAGDGSKARMILFNDHMRVALVTTHMPVSGVAGAMTKESVADAISSLAGSLLKDFAVQRPKIAVLSLNPHSGDGGLLGNEEREIIIPALEEASGNGMLVFGPFAADGFFGNGDYRHFDGIVAMYHDQGLAPFKALAGQTGVNFTAGLPFVRTSPDHGTAFSIAWKGEADETSMREAIYKACDIFRRRKIHGEISANPLRCQVPRNADQKKPPRMRKDFESDKDLQE